MKLFYFALVCFLLSLLIFPLLAPPQTVLPDDGGTIRVMSFNVRYNNPGDGINAWPHRFTRVAEMMGELYQADIVGLQEVLRGQVEDLVRHLPEFDWVGVGRDDGWKEGEFSPIFYRRDRLELLQVNTFWLSETPEIPGSKSWDAAITRIVTWGRFRDKRSGKGFYFFNTHFDHRGVQARLESARLLRERLTRVSDGVPVILTGDMNLRESSTGYRLLVEDRSGLRKLLDARYVSEAAHQGPTATTSNWVELRAPESRIDYILVSPEFRVKSHTILDDRFDGRYPSDHLPVLAEVALDGPGR